MTIATAVLERVEIADGRALPYVDTARQPIPPRQWAVHDRIPTANVTLLSGEGAIGKSLLLLQLTVAHALGLDWIGTVPEIGPAMYLSCEDDEDELCRRLEAIAEYHKISRVALRDRLHLISLAGKDAILAAPERNGRMCPTDLFGQLRADALKIRPKIIVIDNVADVFGGNENDRAQTRQFITMLRGPAIETGAAVVLASHPSLTGIHTGTGLSGNTAWHNSVRARMYLKALSEADTGENGLRVLETRKNNYGPVSEHLVLRWRNGVFVVEPRIGSLEQLAADAKIDNVFLELLRRLTTQNRNVTHKISSAYAPAVFVKEPEATKDRISSEAFAKAMTRLFAAKKITAITEGPPSRQRTRIIEAEHDASN